MLDQAYALRYQVYCVENPFEDPTKQLNDRETDRYDEHSAHAVLIYKSNASVVGCVRLILPDPSNPTQALPIRDLLETEGQRLLDRYPIGKTAEISRYAVSKQFRRRAGETVYPDVGFFDMPQENSHRVMPHLSLGLMQGIAKLSVDRGITHVCAAMAPALLRLLSRFGLSFETLGPMMEYHGLRQPCVADCESLLSGMAAQNMEFYRIVNAAYHGDESAPS